MGIRTDMAVEAHEILRRSAEKIDGVELEVSKNNGIVRTVIDITNDNGAKALGKLCGRYVTIETPDLKYSTDTCDAVSKMLANEIRAMCKGAGKVLVAGLGNRMITPDALGCAVVDKLIVTAHMKKYMPGVFGDNFGCVSAIAPGVMGKTGIETLKIIKGVADTEKPDTVIAIDALAGADISRVTTSIQIADTGIAPGSGVGNHRDGLNESTLGVKVIAIGVPTVIAAEILSDGKTDGKYKSLMVTTNDIDLVIKRMSRTVANGINLALHKGLSIKQSEELAE